MIDPVKLEHFRNLVSLSAADGKIEEAERASLVKIARALEIPSDRLHVMLTHAHEYVYVIPQNNKDKEQQLKDMIDLAWVDGHFAWSERELIKSIAHKLGFTHREADDMITAYSDRFDTGLNMG